MSEALELSALTGPELQALVELETQTRVIHARKLDLINKIRHRGIAKDNGYPNEAKLLTHLLRISPRKAKTWSNRPTSSRSRSPPPDMWRRHPCQWSAKPCRTARSIPTTSR